VSRSSLRGGLKEVRHQPRYSHPHSLPGQHHPRRYEGSARSRSNAGCSGLLALVFAIRPLLGSRGSCCASSPSGARVPRQQPSSPPPPVAESVSCRASSAHGRLGAPAAWQEACARSAHSRAGRKNAAARGDASVVVLEMLLHSCVLLPSLASFARISGQLFSRTRPAHPLA